MESGTAGPRGPISPNDIKLVERKTDSSAPINNKQHFSENRETRLKSEFDNYGAIIASGDLDEDDALEQSFNFSEEEAEVPRNEPGQEQLLVSI